MHLNGRFRRLLLSVTLASVAVVSLAGVAAAHECYNASRNAKADANAANSNGWAWASEIVLRFVLPDELGLDPLTDEQLAEALAIVEAERAAGVEVYALDRALLTHALAGGGHGAYGGDKSSDGRGIDHATANLDQFGPLVEHLVGIYFAVSS